MKTPTLKLYRMPDAAEGTDSLRVSFVVTLNGVPLIKASELRPLTPWSPDDVECPQDVHSLVLSLEKALGIYCGWSDIREERKVTRFKMPGVPGFKLHTV
jgi:hypothetical protein